jgi:hypothetical protein
MGGGELNGRREKLVFKLLFCSTTTPGFPGDAHANSGAAPKDELRRMLAEVCFLAFILFELN